MLKRRSHIVLILFVLLTTAEAFANDQDSSKQLSYLEFGSSNDLFQNQQQSDKYFSAAFEAAYYNHFFENNIAKNILLGSDEGYNIYGLRVRQNGFTPEDLTILEVDSTDRPYAGTLSLQYWRLSERGDKWKYASALKVGVSGPASLTEHVQTGIHKATSSTLPQGWDNQIANSIIIDYFAYAERQFLNHNKHLRLSLAGYGEVGSFTTFGGVFGSAKIGWFYDDRFKGLNYHKGGQRRKWQLYTQFAIGSRAVLYDGTLQGGLIPLEESPYTLSWADYQHVTAQMSYSVYFAYKNFRFRYSNIVEVNRHFLEEAFNFGSLSFIVPISYR